MKLRNFTLILPIFLFACNGLQDRTDSEDGLNSEVEKESIIKDIDSGTVETIEIEGCEYIILKASPRANQGFGLMSHKGNCKNLIHYHNRDSVQ
ncbi:MAG: hypothetical protein ABJG47_17475 [Ekhidna sp.]